MKVLVFDDEQDVCFLYELILRNRGHEVETRNDCTQVLQDVSRVQPDIIFMDHSMPGISGWEAIKKLKLQPNHCNIPIVLCSASWNADLLAKDAKADYFLPKPFSAKDLDRYLASIDSGATH